MRTAAEERESKKAMPMFGLPALFVGLKGGTAEGEAARSPTSPLDGKLFGGGSRGLAGALTGDGELRLRVLIVAAPGGEKRVTPEWTVSPAEAPPAPLPAAADFLKACEFCRKDLAGREVYVYGGEMGFCSAGCRAAAVPDDEGEDAAAGGGGEKWHLLGGPLVSRSGGESPL